MLTSSSYQSRAARRKLADAGSRTTDPVVSVSQTPVCRPSDPATTRSRHFPNAKLSVGARTRRPSSRDAYVLPPAVPAVILGHYEGWCSYEEATTVDQLPGEPEILRSHPVDISDSSGSESDTKGSCAPSIRRRAARVTQQSHSNDEERRHPTSAAAKLTFTTGSSASLHNVPLQESQQQSAAFAPPRPPAGPAATVKPTAKPARAFPAVLSMLVLLLALGTSSRVLRSALSWRKAADSTLTGSSSAVGHLQASNTWQPVISHHAPAGTAAAWFPTAMPLSTPGGLWHSSRQLLHTVAQASKLAAGWLGREAVSNYLGDTAMSTSTSVQPSGFKSDIRSQRSVNAAAVSGEAAVTSSAAAGTTTTPDAAETRTSLPAGAIQMYAVIDDSVISPYKGATWGDVIHHIAKRLQWSDSRFILNVVTQQQLRDDASTRERLSQALSKGGSDLKSSPIFVGIAVTDPEVVSFIKGVTAKLPTALFWDSGEDLARSSRVDGFAPASAGPVAQLLAERVGFSQEARAANVLNTLGSLWSRHTSDDLLFIWLVLLNEYVTPVPSVANTTKGTDLQSLYCMIKNCGQKIMDCVTDTTCKKGLDCLQGCAFNDQVCQYRCIVSYESPKFEKFSLCILQLHNCRGLDAQMPMVPDPSPMTSWRGQAMTHEVAESLFIGWIAPGPQLPEGGDAGLKPYSWLVAAGKNPAYDYFPCQHQLYSYGKGKGQMWYEPVFKAITLDGQEVWRRRRYRVRRGSTSGTFYYSVLDNGVTSNEYWRIIDCADDLTYCLFYYSGAAATAGLSYSGAVLGTVDGAWPDAYTERIHAALQAAGIEPWELSMVDNSQCVGAPL